MKKYLLVSIFFLAKLAMLAQEVDSLQIVTVKKITIEGNQRTKPQIITRELSFELDSSYARYQLDSMFVWDRNRIYNLTLFNETEIKMTDLDEESVEVTVTVDERWYVYPIPIFRLIDRNFNDWWVNRNRDFSRVNYGLRSTHYNFRGRAELLRFSIQGGFTRRFNLTYRIPYIDRQQKHGLNFDINYLETKNLAFDTEDNVRTFLESEDLLRKSYRNRVTHVYRHSFYSFHFFSAGHSSVTVADTIVALNDNYLANGSNDQKYLTLGYGYTWDKRNNRNYPTEGSWHSVGVRKYGLGVYDEVDFATLEYRLTKYWDLGKDFYFAANKIGFVSLPRERDFFNFFAIGFQRSVLRGFDLNIIEGSSFVIQKNEIKKKLFGNKYNLKRYIPFKQFQTFPFAVFGKVFFDQGYAQSYPGHDGSSALTDRYLYSYGLGLDFMLIYDAVLRLEFSKNTTGETNFFINFMSAL